MDKEKDFTCICGGYILKVSLWANENDVVMAFYNHGKKGWFSERWLHLKKILKDGNPFNDAIILDKKDFNEFKNFIDEIHKTMNL